MWSGVGRWSATWLRKDLPLFPLGTPTGIYRHTKIKGFQAKQWMWRERRDERAMFAGEEHFIENILLCLLPENLIPAAAARYETHHK